MYCPNCAASIDGVKFCRSCGANVSLVPQALTGQLPEAVTGRGRSRRLRHRDRGSKPPSIESATTTFFTGIGFVLAAILVIRYMPAGYLWGWSFFIPALSCLGQGVGEYLRWHELYHRQLQPPVNRQEFNAPYINPALGQPDPQVEMTSVPTTSSLAPPPSVTERTTRHLEPSHEESRLK
jgi:hypothetical protein